MVNERYKLLDATPPLNLCEQIMSLKVYRQDKFYLYCKKICHDPALLAYRGTLSKYKFSTTVDVNQEING